MDNQEAFGRQEPKAFPLPCLRASSILAQASPCRPFPKAAKQGRAWGDGGEEETCLAGGAFNCPGARWPFYSSVVCSMVYVAIKLNPVNCPASTGSLVVRIPQTSA